MLKKYQEPIGYCANYSFSFSGQAVGENLTPEDLWRERFGDDPLWGRR